jgi:hypothetical protein
MAEKRAPTGSLVRPSPTKQAKLSDDDDEEDSEGVEEVEDDD